MDRQSEDASFRVPNEVGRNPKNEIAVGEGRKTKIDWRNERIPAARTRDRLSEAARVHVAVQVQLLMNRVGCDRVGDNDLFVYAVILGPKRFRMEWLPTLCLSLLFPIPGDRAFDIAHCEVVGVS